MSWLLVDRSTPTSRHTGAWRCSVCTCWLAARCAQPTRAINGRYLCKLRRRFEFSSACAHSMEHVSSSCSNYTQQNEYTESHSSEQVQELRWQAVAEAQQPHVANGETSQVGESELGSVAFGCSGRTASLLSTFEAADFNQHMEMGLVPHKVWKSFKQQN